MASQASAASTILGPCTTLRDLLSSGEEGHLTQLPCPHVHRTQAGVGGPRELGDSSWMLDLEKPESEVFSSLGRL